MKRFAPQIPKAQDCRQHNDADPEPLLEPHRPDVVPRLAPSIFESFTCRRTIVDGTHNRHSVVLSDLFFRSVYLSVCEGKRRINRNYLGGRQRRPIAIRRAHLPRRAVLSPIILSSHRLAPDLWNRIDGHISGMIDRAEKCRETPQVSRWI